VPKIFARHLGKYLPANLPVRRMISLVPTPSALERIIAARQACFCEALRSLVIASTRPRTDRVIVMEIPLRMRQTRTATETEEIPIRTLLSGKDHALAEGET
jgi:hypothetical protein